MNSETHSTLRLTQLRVRDEAIIVAVRATGGVPAELLRRLNEIGFLPGESVRILSRGLLGGSPLAVRVGTSTFALRKSEAQCIEVRRGEHQS